jgi:lipoprotein NlpI
MPLISALKEKTRQLKTTPQTNPVGMGESEMQEGDMYERSRFEEVFDLDPEEDYSVDDRSVKYGINPYEEQPELDTDDMENTSSNDDAYRRAFDSM